MTRVLHLVVGPQRHGVVRHGLLVADACGHDVRHVADVGGALVHTFAYVDVVHVPFTDRLFAPHCEDALVAFRRIADRVHQDGAALSVTLHDVPVGGSELARRRRAVYRSVVSAARGVVVNSRTELALVQDDADNVHSLCAIALPVESVHWAKPQPVDPGAADVVVLGFVFPDRGYEQVIDSLPSGSRLVALGSPADGHDDLAARLAAHAARRQREWQLTGYVPDAELPARLAGAAVPVAPNARVTASASIATWLAHGRRPLVPATDYTRELLARWPGALRLYDADDSHDLRAALDEALADPASTWLTEPVPDSSVSLMAERYCAHLDSCAPPAAVVMKSGESTVPGNRWDLLPSGPARSATVSVVIPYYDAQRQLDLVLTALSLQTYPRDRFEVIVADDGSPRAPDVSAAGGLTVRTVRQDHRGFGAARARNLGARAASGDVLVFLDGDTVPEPGYIEHLTRLPAGNIDCLVVGRRRHAALSGWDAGRVRDWLVDAAVPPRLLPEPDWLRDAYGESDDLLRADDRSYRFVISAVLGMHRALFERIGGFSEQFTEYGGEDWELANRAWHGGALFAHVRDAVAWHDGGDWAERAEVDRRAAKNAETLRLSGLLPDRRLRGAGQWHPYPSTVVLWDNDDPVTVLAVARSAFVAGVDCGFWLTGSDAPAVVQRLADQRIHAGHPPRDVYERASALVHLQAPADLGGLQVLCDRAVSIGAVHTPALTVSSTRLLARVGQWGPDYDGADDLGRRLFGRHERSAPLPAEPIELDRLLGGLSR